MSDLAIKTEFRAIDKVSDVTKKIGKNVTAFSGKIGKKMQKLGAGVKKVGAGFANVAKKGAIVAAVLVGVGAAIFAVNKAGIEFEKTIDSVAAKFGDISPDQLKAVEDQARKTGAETEFSAIQAAQGLNFLALAGFNAEQSIAALPKIVDLATLAEIDLGRASDIATDSLGAFSLASEDAEVQAANLQDIINVMAKTSTSANTSVEELFGAIGAGAKTFSVAGQSMRTFNALAGKLADATIKGEDAGTKLRNIMLSLSKPTGEAATVLKKLNVNVADSQGNFRDIVDIIGDFETGLKSMGTQQQSAALKTIFGKQTVNAFSTLLGEGSEKLRDYRTTLEDVDKTAEKMAAQMRDNVAGQIKSFQSRIEGVRITIFKIMQPLLEKIFTRLVSMTAGLESFLRANEKLIGSGLNVFLAKAKEVLIFLFNVFKKITNVVSGLVEKLGLVAIGVLLFQKIKDIVGAVIPIIKNIIALIGVWLEKIKNAGAIRVIVELFGQIGDIFTFIVKKVIEFAKHLDKVGVIDFIIQGFTLLVNIIRLIGVLIKPIVSIIFKIGKILFAMLMPLFKGFALLFRGINKIFEFVDKKRATKLKIDTEFNIKKPDFGGLDFGKTDFGKTDFKKPDKAIKVVTPETPFEPKLDLGKFFTPNMSLIEQKKKEKAEVDINVNAPAGTTIKQRGDGNIINLKLGKQGLLVPVQ